MNEYDGLCGQIRMIVADGLGDRVTRTLVTIRDHGYFIAVGIVTTSGLRHAVGGSTAEARENPEAWAAGALEKLSAWLDARGAG